MKKQLLFSFFTFFLLNFIGHSQATFFEGFENTTGPSASPSTEWALQSGNWHVFQNTFGPTERWKINSTVATPPMTFAGSNAAISSVEEIGLGNTSEDYLTMPLVTVPTNGQLRFFSRTFTSGNQGTIYQIKIAPATVPPTNIAAYTTLAEYTENELVTTIDGVQNPFNIYTEKVVDIPTTFGPQVYISFVRKFTQTTPTIGGDRWLLDNVRIAQKCLDPFGLTAQTVTFNQVNLSWNNPSGSSSWEIEILPISDTPTGSGVVYSGTLPYIASGLSPNTQYKYYVRSLCSDGITSNWVGPMQFSTSFAPPVCGGNYLDSGQATANYSNNEDSNITICPTTPGEVVSVTFSSFDVESNNDALYVFNGNSSSSPQILTSNSGGNVPGGLAGGYWGTTVPGPFTSSSPDGCLTFRFRSNATITNSGWIANVNCITMDFCMQPSQVTVTNITDTSVTLNWVENNASTAWHILALPQGSPQPTAATTGWIAAATSPFVLTGLTPNTCYDFYIRSSCNPNDNSVWSAPVTNCSYDCEDYGTCSDSIMVVAFIDSNANGIKDVTESNFNYGYCTYSINDGNPIYSYSNNGDFYIPSTNPANSYDLSFFIPSYLTSFYSTSASYQNITIVAASGINYYYFPVTQIMPYIDVSTNLNAESPRPGFTRYCELYYKNNATTTTNGTITFVKNNLETINSVSQTGTVTTPNGFTYNYTNLAPNETRYISIILQTPTIPTVNLGDLLTISSHISNISGEFNLENNNSVLTQAVIGSYDPNEVYESHGPEIPINNFTSNDYLNYTITFENTGTANAEFIRIENMLHNKLNPSTIEMIGSSHNYDLKRENNKLTWFFYDIDLPPTSQNPILSHGFVSYRIKPNPGFAIGDIIPNTASIFFDYNPPIITNTFNTEFVAPLNNLDFNSDNFLLYPNPATDLVQISSNINFGNIESIVIFDVLGKVVKKVDAVNSNQTNINVSELSSGVYMVEVATDNKVKQVKKLVIK
ncbi:T9SS type A sorting domain-containing protein [Flavobacterium sp.]|uniref:T9SS-dependent choice-of-anchor J family protein n=1 Tax=Flavobacterium sp. TaxID=239 RepID=UPI000EBA0CA7|nr:T9SS type A sorting domain-containing protein [Flavobacterium sp.]HCQ12630.1 hypothetical protein [Flavobacterium sp.]